MSAASTPSRLYSFSAAAATALLLSLAMPGGTGWWPLLFFALVPLLSAVCRLPPMRCACMGMFCGLLYNIGLLYWIVIVLGRYGGLPPWLSVPGMVLLALYMAIYFSLFCLLLNLVLKRSDPEENLAVRLIWLAPVLWVGLDYLRGIALTGFPWMDLGYGLYSRPELIQIADLGGHYLVTFCLLLSNALLTSLLRLLKKSRPQVIRSELVTIVCACLLLIGLGSYSFLRYQQVTAEMARQEHATLTVVQGNITQEKKWTAAAREHTVAIYLALARKAVAKERINLMVWPETALPFYPQQDPLISNIVTFVRDNHVPLLTGAPFFRQYPGNTESREPVQYLYFNSALLLDASGRLKGLYDKQHLVPFGEYVPLRSYLSFLKPLVVSVGHFSAGSLSRPLVIGKIKAGVLICFESIFPDIARREVEAGSNLLINLTNDAWYGRSSAPYHSLAMAVFRAVETRRTLVRSANTGISGFVEPTGVIPVQSRLFVPASLTARVPLCRQQTIFTRIGHWFGTLCLLLIIPLLLVRRGK